MRLHKMGLFFILIYSSVANGKIINECELIRQAKIFGAINPQLVLAISEVESSKNSRAIGRQDQDIHYGLMQLKLGTARMLGFKGHPKDLLQWKLNLKYGIIYLNEKLVAYRSIHAASAAYNAGAAFICRKGVNCKKGRYVNQGYVDLVMNQYKKKSKLQCDSSLASR